jgi:hypothetical protein
MTHRGAAVVVKVVHTSARRLLPVLCLILASCSGGGGSAQDKPPQLLGKVSWTQWRQATGTAAADVAGQFPPEKIDRLRSLVAAAHPTFVVFGSTECDECREQLPKLFGIFEAAGTDGAAVELYGLDAELREPGGAQKRFEIPGTPCLFVLLAGRVAGRIAYPDFHWLDGIIRILSGD